jgi:hypothetical protein
MCTECPKQIKGWDPVDWNVPRPEVVHEFRRTLKNARDERPLQTFFEKHPVALLTGILKPHTAWVFRRLSLPLPGGGGGVPDFIICEWSSNGPTWTIVELESPRRSPVKRTGKSWICNHAIEQINDYRRYLGVHADFLRGLGWKGIHGNCDGVVVIGRRTDSKRVRLSRYLQDCRDSHIEIRSYDGLLEECAEMQQHIEQVRRGIQDVKHGRGAIT